MTYLKNYRSPILYSSHEGHNVTGNFDPLSFIVRLDEKSFDTFNHLHNLSQLYWNEQNLTASAGIFHETLHWWQYIGSFFGFFEGLKNLTQTSVTISALKEYIKHFSPKKPFFKSTFEGTGVTREEFKFMFNVCKNWYDIELTSAVLMSPSIIPCLDDEVYLHNFNDSLLGYVMSNYGTIAKNFKKDIRTEINYPEWVYERRMKLDQEAFNYPFIKELSLSDFGTTEILEGYARLSEIQLLCVQSSNNLSWQLLKQHKYLDGGKYSAAFSYYLNQCGLKEPTHALDAVVGIFLLICDLSLNSPALYLSSSYEYDTCFYDYHPVIRLKKIVHIIAQNVNKLIRNFSYTDESYWYITDYVCSQLHEIPYRLQLLTAINFFNRHSCIVTQMSDKELFSSSSINVKFFLRKHILFIKQKMTSPSKLCWPGALIDHLMQAKSIFDEFSVPFVTPMATGRISATIAFSKDVKHIENYLFDFIIGQIIADIVRQWVKNEGKFILKYSWISSQITDSFSERLATDYFHREFNFDINKIQII